MQTTCGEQRRTAKDEPDCPLISVDLMPWAGYFMIIKIGFDYTFLTGTEIGNVTGFTNRLRRRHQLVCILRQ